MVNVCACVIWFMGSAAAAAAAAGWCSVADVMPLYAFNSSFFCCCCWRTKACVHRVVLCFFHYHSWLCDLYWFIVSVDTHLKCIPMLEHINGITCTLWNVRLTLNGFVSLCRIRTIDRWNHINVLLTFDRIYNLIIVDYLHGQTFFKSSWLGFQTGQFCNYTPL